METTIDFESESAVVTALVFGQWDSRLTVDHFGSPDCRNIYGAVKDLRGEGFEPDALNVCQRARDEGKMDADVFWTLIDPNALCGEIDFRYQCRRLEEMRLARSKAALLAGDDPLPEFKAKAAALAPGFDDTGTLRHVREIASEWLERMDRISRGEISPEGILTGFPKFDHATGGLEPARLIVVAARPNVGKTSLILNWATAIALRKIPVAFFSLEMTRPQVISRIISQMTGIENRKFRRAEFSKVDFGKIAECMAKLEKSPLWIDDDSEVTAAMIRERVTRLDPAPKAVFVDYLQILKTPGKGDNRQAEVGEMSRQLKAMTKELNIPVIVAAQLNRGPETSGVRPRPPRMSDLRESGSIEQEADIGYLLWEAEERTVNQDGSEHEPDPDAVRRVKSKIAKDRDGPKPEIDLDFWPAVTTFIESSK